MIIVMKDIKTIIKARVALGGITVKNATIIGITVYEGSDKGRYAVSLRINKDVPAMVKVTQIMIDAANRKLANAKAAHDKAVADKAENVDELKAVLDEATAEVASLELDKFVEGTSTTVWSSNYELNAILRNNPKTAFLAKKLTTIGDKGGEVARTIMEDLYMQIFGFSTANVLAEKVIKDQEYMAPFSDRISTVVNDSYYTTLYDFTLGEDAADNVRYLHKKHIAELYNKLDAASTKKKSDDDDDEDDAND